jgi:hypothetical protein
MRDAALASVGLFASAIASKSLSDMACGCVAAPGGSNSVGCSIVPVAPTEATGIANGVSDDGGGGAGTLSACPSPSLNMQANKTIE